MGAEAAEDVIEALIAKGQLFGDALPGPDIVQSALAGAVGERS